MPRALNLGLGLSGPLARTTLNEDWISPVVGAALAGVMLALAAWGYGWVRGQEGLGLGDILLFTAAGAWLGPARLAPALLIGTTAALVYVGRRWLSQRRDGLGQIRFAPALALGIWLAFVPG